MFEVVAFHPHEKGAKKGYLDISVPSLDWMICGCTLFEKDGQQWIKPPEREYKDSEGKSKYAPIIKMGDETRKAFSATALHALKIFQMKEVEDELSEMLPF